MDRLSQIIKSFNNYVQVDRISDFGIENLVRLQNMLYKKDDRKKMIIPTDKIAIAGETKEQTKKRILERTITHCFLCLHNYGLLHVYNVVNIIIIFIFYR